MREGKSYTAAIVRVNTAMETSDLVNVTKCNLLPKITEFHIYCYSIKNGLVRLAASTVMIDISTF